MTTIKSSNYHPIFNSKNKHPNPIQNPKCSAAFVKILHRENGVSVHILTVVIHFEKALGHAAFAAREEIPLSQRVNQQRLWRIFYHGDTQKQ